MRSIRLSILFFVALVVISALPLPSRAAEISFNRDIRPILSDNCFACHGFDAKSRKAGLRLDTHEGGTMELESGARAIVPGKSGESELFHRITTDDKIDRMPPRKTGKTLTAKQVDLLKRWIDQGATWEAHWAFIAPRRPELPAVKNKAWPRNAIDFFILAKLEREGLVPSPPADARTLLRRASFDLTGLPPIVEELRSLNQSAIRDPQSAITASIDRLLASPRYGEHMASFWLDAARYADTNGYQGDQTRTMWLWRDWVVRAFNDNMPFDQFTMLQIAGDLMEKESGVRSEISADGAKPTHSRGWVPVSHEDRFLATGFNRNHPLNGEGGRIPEESRVEYVMDRVETTGAVWLGLTVGCCRCHDHKYDPILQQEYYQFYAYFNSIDERGNVDAGGNANPVMAFPTPQQLEQAAALKKEMATSPDAKKKLAELEKSYTRSMIMRDLPKPRETFVLKVGQYDQPDKNKPASPGVPHVLHALPEGAPSNRLALARWLVAPDNPLTARVIVNRLWQQVFGIGLVKTSEDFGVQGEPPSHPDLLDWLAVEFVESGWDVKHMMKLMLSSATYQQSSRVTPLLLERDPDNRLLARGPRFRLTVFQIRDQALQLSGLLVDKMGGPGVKPYQPPGPWEEFSLGKIKYEQDHGEALYRRSLYTFWRRSVAPTMFFDTPSRQVCVVRQARTNTPLQALTLMNDVAYIEAARAMAQRVMKEGGGDADARLKYAFELATSHPPKPEELKLLCASFDRSLSHFKDDAEAAKKLLAVGESKRDETLDAAEHAAYTAVMTVILNLDEVITKE